MFQKEKAEASSSDGGHGAPATWPLGPGSPGVRAAHRKSWRFPTSAPVDTGRCHTRSQRVQIEHDTMGAWKTMRRVHRSLGKTCSAPSRGLTVMSCRLHAYPESNSGNWGAGHCLGPVTARTLLRPKTNRAPLSFTGRDGWISAHAAESQGDRGGGGCRVATARFGGL